MSKRPAFEPLGAVQGLKLEEMIFFENDKKRSVYFIDFQATLNLT